MRPRRFNSSSRVARQSGHRPAVAEAKPDWAQRLTAIAAVGALLVSAWTIRYTQASTSTATEQLRVFDEQQIAGRFATAVEQLTSEKVEVRIGGLLALERIMRDSPKHQPAVVEMLAVFVRERAPRAAESEPFKTGDRATPPEADVQEAMTVIGRRDRTFDRPGDVINLAGVNLGFVNLAGAKLAHSYWEADYGASAYLHWANLAGADLSYAKMSGVDLRSATLDGANLRNADLRVATLSAHLNGADLRDANLAQASLGHADLTAANVAGANFAYADLRGANLADIQKSNVPELENKQFRCALIDERTRLPTGFSLPVKRPNYCRPIEYPFPR